jgi:hypothetical protein
MSSDESTYDSDQEREDQSILQPNNSENIINNNDDNNDNNNSNNDKINYNNDNTKSNNSHNNDNTGERDKNFINLKLLDQSGNELFFRVKKTVKMSKVIDTYCSRQGIALRNVRFLFDGVRLQPKDTPESLEMENDDIVDVVLQQTGGGNDVNDISNRNKNKNINIIFSV